MARGHAFRLIWEEYTPRQVLAFYGAARRNRETEMAENLIIAALGAQGDKDGIEKQMAAWGD